MKFDDLHVVIVEDHEFQRRMAAQMLRSLGVVHLHEAGDGLEALERLRGLPQPPDIVISDLEMPGMDGIEFIRNLAEHKLARAVAVASGMDPSMLHTVETMARAYGLQVLGTIEKPTTARRLTQVLGLYQQADPASGAGALDNDADLSADRLRQALDNGEFVAWFQPKINLLDGRPSGVEALARWCRPGDTEPLAPSGFLPALEKAGLLDRLTDAILCQACRAQTEWQTRGVDLGVSVNVSMLTLNDVHIADHFLQQVQKCCADPRKVTFEVTENAVMQDTARALDVLARLRLKGFGLSIDDFGTGYASMQQLGAIPFTELKVDQSFVRDAARDPRRRTMVETSLELARKLKLRSVAEGAESREDWDLLVSLGCDQVQGWFVARAMPAEQMVDWATQWTPPQA